MSVFLILALAATAPQQAADSRRSAKEAAFALAATAPQQAADSRRSAKEAAAAFTLDSVAPPPNDAAASADDTAVPPPVAEAATRASSPPLPAKSATRPASPSWLDIPIASLIANPTTKAVLDRDLPGLAADKNLARFEAKTLREFQPLTGGQLTDALLEKVQADISVAPPPPPSAKAHRSER